MNSKYRILSAITRGVWAVEPSLVEGYMSFIDDLLAHKPEANTTPSSENIKHKQAANDNADWAKLNAVHELERENYWRAKEQQFFAIQPGTGKRTVFFDDAPEGSVAVIPVEDVIMRNDYCGAMGLETIEQVATFAALHRNISGIIFKLHTPGGSIDYLKETSNTIANISKPTIAFISGMCASAGIYLSSHCDYVIAENDLALVGSIGVMMTLRDTRKQDEMRGIKTIVIYGPESTYKNKVYHDAIDGKTDPLIKEQLGPFNEDFINVVKTGRGSKLNDKHPTMLKGATFFAKDIIEHGLIDEINSFAYAVNLAAGKAQVGSNNNSNTKQTETNMFNKFPKLTALAGKPSADITAEDLQAVNAELKERGVNASLMTEAVLTEQVTAETAALNNELAATKVKVDNLTASLNKANAQLIKAVSPFKTNATAEEAMVFDVAGEVEKLKSADAGPAAGLGAEKDKEIKESDDKPVPISQLQR